VQIIYRIEIPILNLVKLDDQKAAIDTNGRLNGRETNYWVHAQMHRRRFNWPI